MLAAMSYLSRVRTSASVERLEQLIAERLKPGADKARIDRRIWDLFGEDWAVLFTDLTGFSRNVAEFGIIHFLQVILESERAFAPCIDEHGGILLKSEGDSLLVIFRRPENALRCAVGMQRASAEYNQGRPPEEHILPCLGLGFGPVIRLGDQDVFGAEVNAASKLGEDAAESGDIFATEAFKAACGAVDGVAFEPIAFVPSGARAAYRARYR